MTKPEKFLVEGVGKGSIPGCMDFTVIDDVVKVANTQGIGTGRQQFKIIFTGIQSSPQLINSEFLLTMSLKKVQFQWMANSHYTWCFNRCKIVLG